MTAQDTQDAKRKPEVRSDGKIRSTIYWERSMQDWAAKMAAREHMSVNRFINVTVERLWIACKAKKVETTQSVIG